MDVDQIRQMLELMREHGLAEFEYKGDGERIRLRRADLPAGEDAGGRSATPAPDGDRRGAQPEVVTVDAPILGTFFRAAGPDQPPFVQIGDVVHRGDPLCVIEAMKLMNDIKADCDGDVVDIFVENGQPVQYGDRLFAIRPHPHA